MTSIPQAVERTPPETDWKPSTEAEVRAKARQVIAEADGWPEPTPLHVTLKPVPVMDPALLPGPLAAWLVDVAERMQAPLEFVSVDALVMLGSLLGRKLAIRPRAHDDWAVHANLWGVTIGPPSSKKSPAQAAVRKPLDAIEAEAGAQHADAMRDWKRRSMLVELGNKATAKALETALKNRNNGMADDLSRGIEEPPAAPIRRRLVTSDATIEKLALLHSENPNGLLVLRDELVGWLRDMDKPGRESSRAFFLESWAGDGRFTVDRVSRDSVFIQGLCLSILGCCVPGSFGGFVSEALEDGRGADGLLQRFQLAVWPDVSGDWQDVDRWPNHSARDMAGDCYRMLDMLDPASIGAETDKYSDTPYVRFNTMGQGAWNEWYSEIENRARRSGFTAWQSYLGKLPKAVAGLALLCHLINGGTGPVTLDAALQALAWGEFLEGHAARIYLSGTARQSAAQILLSHLRAGDVKDGDSLRDVARHEWSKLDSPATVREAAADLEQAGYIRVSKSTSLPTGGRPTEQITINPKLKEVADYE